MKVVCFFLLLYANYTYSDDRFANIDQKLKELSSQSLGLNDKVELSVNAVPLTEFLRGIANSSNLNVSIDPSITTKITNNFSNVTVAEVFVFICKKYELDINFVGSIMSFVPYTVPAIVIAKQGPKPLKIAYESSSNTLSFDLNNDSLAAVTKEITRLSKKNIVFTTELTNKIVGGYIQNASFDKAMEKFALANDLKVSVNDDFYVLEKVEVGNNVATNSKINSKNGNNLGNNSQGINVKLDANNKISLEVTNAPINDVLSMVSKEVKVNYFLFNDVKGNASLNINGAGYDDFLNYLFNGTDYTFKKEGAIYLIGDRNIEGLRSTKVIALKYRTIDKVIDVIPTDLKKGLEIKSFRDLNCFIVSGSLPRMNELEGFLRDIDRVVPVISIEVMIVDVNNSNNVTSGIKAGLKTEPTRTSGDLYPELNLNLGANSINSIITGINGLGVVNLGRVTPNFYLSLQMMEKNGDLNIKSTPLLSTLNGNEAKMSIGETRYYVENNSNVIATQNTTTVNTQIYKPLSAEFSMTVNPIVSGDEQITLEITVKKQSFTERTGTNGPFGSSTRDFQSLIRVKNQEMIMLGGLDDNTKSSSSSGVPWLSRIPVLRWFFSSRTKSNTKSKLTIFIKPTVIY